MFNKSKRNRRRAAATVEFAVIIPIILTLTFGTLEICAAIFLKEKATIAAHEGARVAIRKYSTTSDVISAAQDYLESRGIDTSGLPGGAITVSPAPESTPELSPITVHVTLPVAGNTSLPDTFHSFISGLSMEAEAVMYKEFPHPDYEP
jgi:Flp pilus assembly protein TadG